MSARLAYVCADPGVPVFGRKGCSVHVQELLRAWIAAGWSIDLFASTLGGLAPADLAGVRIHLLPLADGLDPAARERACLAANDRLRAALRLTGPFDLLYERHALWSCAAMEYACGAAIPGLLEVNAPLVEEQQQYRLLVDRAGAEAARQRAFAAASALLAVSTPLAETLVGLGASRARLHVVPNGVNPDRFPAEPAGARDHDGPFTIGFVGTLKPWHGVDVLVEAFAQLQVCHARSRLLLVGDGPERAAVEQRLRSLGIRDACTMTGAADPSAVPGLLASMDVAVAPYPFQTGFYFSPLKLFEYMAAGLPVVASDLGQVREVVTHDQTGLLSAPGDPGALAAAVSRLRDDLALRQRLGRNASAAVRRAHTWSGIVARLERLAQRVACEEAAHGRTSAR